MRLSALSIIIMIAIAALVAGAAEVRAAAIPAGVLEIETPTGPCHAPMLKIAERPTPFSKQKSNDGTAGSMHISASDIVPHASLTTISPLTFAIVIGLINDNADDRRIFFPPAPARTVFDKVLFRAFISPNAP